MASDDTFRLRVLRTGSISIGLIITIGVLIRYGIAPFNIQVATINLVAGVLLISIRFLIDRGVPRHPLTLLFLLCVASIGFSSGLGAGGMNAPGTLSLSVIPLLGYLLAAHRGAIQGLIITFASVVLILLADYFDLALPVMSEDRLSLARSLNIALIALGTYAIGRAYETSRAISENALQRREQQIRTVIDTSPIGMVVIGENSVVRVLNRKSSELLPKLRADSSFLAAVPEAHAATVSAFLESSSRPSDNDTSRPSLLFSVAHDVETVWVHLEAVPFEPSYADNSQKLLTMTDVTEEVRAEEMRKAFVANSKMAALGEMAGGVAHEINNPLSIIVGKCGTLRSVLREENFDRARVTGELEKIANTAGRIAKITSGLLAFARSGDQDPPGRVRLRDLVDETLAFCSDRFAKAGLAIDVNLNGNEDILLTCRPSQISQVLLNLLNNAFDEVSNEAPPGKKQPEPWVRLDVEISESTVHFVVTDGGFGLPEAIREKVFNPFFTTKPIGFGTGLGLSISKGLIESHGGTLSYALDSRQKLHTSFRASIPLVPPNAS